jgi:hypothetical protein
MLRSRIAPLPSPQARGVGLIVINTTSYHVGGVYSQELLIREATALLNQIADLECMVFGIRLLGGDASLGSAHVHNPARRRQRLPDPKRTAFSALS